MIIAGDIIEQIRDVIGTCSDEVAYGILNEAVELLANTGHWSPLVGFMDICTQGCEITLPDDIEAPLAINVGGHPTEYANKWFEFHLNGPGSQCCNRPCSYSWVDKGDFPTFRDPHRACSLVAYPDTPEAADANFRVYGYDECGKWIMEQDCSGTLVDGFTVPILPFGVPTTQKVQRITRVSKPVTNGFVKLVGVLGNGVLLGYYRPGETNPQFRRIKVSGAGCQSLQSCACTTTWVRMSFRRKVFKIENKTDAIPLHSVTALKMAVMAVEKYKKNILEEYESYFKAASDCLQREEKTQAGPNQIRVQFQPLVFDMANDRNMV